MRRASRYISNAVAKKSLLVLIDGSSYIYRAYFAIPHLSNSKGEPTNAAMGFTTMLLKVLRELKPSHVAIAADPPGGSFRNSIYPEYKATRREIPPDLPPQIPYIKKIIEAFNIPVLEVPNYEADDVIGTAVKRAKKDFDILIVTSDKDLYQLVDENVKLLDTMKDKTTGLEEVRERFGVEPGRVIEVLGLSGDTADNIPGIPGVGEKTARELIERFGTIEGVLSHVAEISGKKRQENLRQFADQARLSKKLVTLDTDVPFKWNPDDYAVREPNVEELRRIFHELEFTRLLDVIGGEPESGRDEKLEYRLVLTEKELAALVAALEAAPVFSFDTETTSEFPMLASLVGISFCAKPKHAFYIPIAHRYLGAPDQLPMENVLGALSPILTDPEKPKIAQNAKYDTIVLANHGVEVRKLEFDTMVASYVLNPARRQHNLAAIAREFLNRTMKEYTDMVGSGAKMKTFDEVEVERAGDYSCDDAEVTFELKQVLEKRIEKAQATDLFRNLDMPLVPVLAAMEMNGVKVDTELLKAISDDLWKQLKKIEEEIYHLAGEKFNPSSPKQLGDVLFDKLGLRVVRKTKTGRSTDSDVLEELAVDHPLPGLILDYRSLAKLRGTYTEALPKLINPKTGRIHTSFNQTVTSTGRLSSSDPNLQNIPVRTEAGRGIREAFVPEKGMLIVSADYNQIELRILAHLSRDETLLDSFRKKQDVHTRTAAEVFGVAAKDVSYEMRRRAKVVNFGIAYGMSAYGLSKQLRIPQREAQTIIDAYFARYPQVRKYMDDNIECARKKGYIQTLRGRKLLLPEINSKNRQVRLFAERAAINAPMQGTAADIIKEAMIEIHNWLKANKSRTKMILQVHDELVFEAPEKDVPQIEKIVQEKMQSVAEIEAPLTVDVNHGKNWAEAH